MAVVLYYIYQGEKPIEGRSLLRVPIDIRASRTSSLDTQLIGEVSSVEELLMFIGDYHWAEGFSYFLRETEEVHPRVKTRIRQILYAKTDRRKNEKTISSEALGKRRPRTYRTRLPPKYSKPQPPEKP